VAEAAESDPLTKEQLADEWVQWFEKRAERYLKAAAAFGYTNFTFDLPIELAQNPINKKILNSIGHRIQPLIPGCTISFVEEEYEEQFLHKLEVSWKATGPQ
jgi:hypothetical protein